MELHPTLLYTAKCLTILGTWWILIVSWLEARPKLESSPIPIPIEGDGKRWQSSRTSSSLPLKSSSKLQLIAKQPSIKTGTYRKRDPTSRHKEESTMRQERRALDKINSKWINNSNKIIHSSVQPLLSSCFPFLSTNFPGIDFLKSTVLILDTRLGPSQ